MKQLVFVHGRAQERKDAAALKAEWIDAWRYGLAHHGLRIPIAESAIRFPYYGDTLHHLAEGFFDGPVPQVVMRRRGGDGRRQAFIDDVLREVAQVVQRHPGVDRERIAEAVGEEVVNRGLQNEEWAQKILQTLDRYVPLASGTTIALATNDVGAYLDNPGIRDEIETGVRAAMLPDVPTVVVAHSLGTVVAYSLLRRDGTIQRWQVPTFITLGSPLAVDAIRRKLAPHRHPPCVGIWFNAFDERDVVALYPLDADHFPLDPAITNKRDVDNTTTNRHGISGYLGDPEVALRLYQAVI